MKDFYDDANYEHMVMPGMVYISQPTEYGTLYSREELAALSKVCRENHLPLYVDGARLAYALASPENDVTLTDLAEFSDAFYIGGTKCGALFGEAVVIPQKGRIPHFFTIIKQHGALLAKGRIAGIQFGELFTDGLYLRIGKPAMEAAEQYYFQMLELGAKPEEARSILPNSLKTEIVMTMNLREWRHFIRLRSANAAHPQMRQVSELILKKFSEEYPLFFRDLAEKKGE